MFLVAASGPVPVPPLLCSRRAPCLRGRPEEAVMSVLLVVNAPARGAEGSLYAFRHADATTGSAAGDDRVVPA